MFPEQITLTACRKPSRSTVTEEMPLIGMTSLDLPFRPNAFRTVMQDGFSPLQAEAFRREKC